MKEAHAEPLLHPRHCLADCRRRDPKLPSRDRKASGFRRPDEGVERSQTVHPRTSISDIGVRYVWNYGPIFKSLGAPILAPAPRPIFPLETAGCSNPLPIKEIIMSSSVVLITGALTGIGRAAAVSFAKAGHRLVVSGRKADAGEALVGELRSFGAEAEFIQADVRREDDVRRLVDRTVERFGRLDVAVNNAGTEGKPGPITDQTAESFAATFDTNVLGVLLSMKHEARVMQGQRSGTIINISSTYGHEGAAGASIYVGAKHAVEGITKSVALETAKSGIRVNAVAPGPTDTGMLTRFTGTSENKAALAAQVPLGRLGLSEEVADGIVFIASDEARFITGHILNVDGGHSAY